MTVRCGNPKHDKTLTREHHHDTVAQVRLCYSLGENILFSHEEEEAAADADRAARAEIEAERGYERHLENAGYWEARADEDHEMAMGIDPFNPLEPAWIPEHRAN